MKRKKIIQYINYRLCRLLIPRCEFEVEITDASGTVTPTMSDKLVEKMLSMTADQIYETTIVKKQWIPVEHVREELSQEWFKIHFFTASKRYCKGQKKVGNPDCSRQMRHPSSRRNIK